MVYILAILAIVTGMTSAPAIDGKAVWFAARTHEACLIVAEDMDLQTPAAQQESCAHVAGQIGVVAQDLGVAHFVPTAWNEDNSALMVGCVGYAAAIGAPLTAQLENSCTIFWQGRGWQLYEAVIDLDSGGYTQL